YICKNCNTHIGSYSQIVSKQFIGRYGEALLLSDLVNISCGAAETRKLSTGEFIICKINCRSCDDYLGWKYLAAESKSQYYKNGMYALELSKVVK
ncbi:yippee zincbinding protein, partial [Lipomyces oligophaga]|uniref:yippee zincbinding protein n=1 Tax=Lipomyces oligophaga TaxID=45792 RepID=UPI0034CF80AE